MEIKMRALIWSVVAAVAVVSAAPAYSQKLGSGLSGKDRTRCLKEQQVQADLNRAKANEQYEKSKSLHESGCKTDKAVKQVLKGEKDLAYRAGRAVGEIAGAKSGC
jgi:hypothetical protein